MKRFGAEADHDRINERIPHRRARQTRTKLPLRRQHPYRRQRRHRKHI